MDLLLAANMGYLCRYRQSVTSGHNVGFRPVDIPFAINQRPWWAAISSLVSRKKRAALLYNRHSAGTSDKASGEQK